MEKSGGAISIIRKGIIDENPLLRLVLGTCPSLAVTVQVTNGLGMGLATTFVLLCSNVIISLLRNFIPAKIRIPAFIIVIATFTTIVQLLLQAYVPDIYDALGIYIPLIVVNCIIMARAESFASKNTVGKSLLDGLGMGLGFTLALVLLSAIRELLGTGCLAGIQVLGDWFAPADVFTRAPGGFMCLGLLLAISNTLFKRFSKEKGDKG